MTRKRQKVSERLIVEAVLKVVAPARAAEVVASERPDFLVDTDKASVGIEVRRLFWRQDVRGRPLQAAEGLEDKAIAKAARLWLDRGLPPVHATVSWLDHTPPVARRVDQIAEQLVDAVAARLPILTIDGEPVTIRNDGLPDDTLPEELFSVHVARFSALRAPFWGISRAGYVAECDTTTIEAALADKEAAVADYRRKAQELWLVLAITEAAPSSFVDVTRDVLEQRYTSSFDRVFLIEVANDRVHELSLVRESRGA